MIATTGKSLVGLRVTLERAGLPPATPDLPQAPRAKIPGTVIACYAPKGGYEVTTVDVHLDPVEGFTTGVEVIRVHCSDHGLWPLGVLDQIASSAA